MVLISASSPRCSPILHEKCVKKLGRNVRLRGFHPVRRFSDLCSSASDPSFFLTVGNSTSPVGPGHRISRLEKPEHLREAVYISEND